MASSYIYPGDVSGADLGDQRLNCGAARWFVSAAAMAKVLFSINARDKKILSEAGPQTQLTQMRQRVFGLDLGFIAVLFMHSNFGDITGPGPSARKVLADAYDPAKYPAR